MAQSVKHLTLAQVMISCFVSSSPVLGSVLTAQNLEPASDSVSPSLCPSPAHALSLSVSKIKKNIFKKLKKKKKKKKSATPGDWLDPGAKQGDSVMRVMKRPLPVTASIYHTCILSRAPYRPTRDGLRGTF